MVDLESAHEEYKIELVTEPQQGVYDAVIIAVAHDVFRDTGAAGLRAFCKAGGVFYDVKYLLPATDVDGRL